MSSQQGRVRLDQPPGPGPDQQASIYNTEMAAMTMKGSCDSQLCRAGKTHRAPARLQVFQAQRSSVGPGGLWCTLNGGARTPCRFLAAAEHSCEL